MTRNSQVSAKRQLPHILVVGPSASGSVELAEGLRSVWPGLVEHRHLPEVNSEGYLLEEVGDCEPTPLNTADETIVIIVERGLKDRLVDSFLIDCTAPWSWPEDTYPGNRRIPNPSYIGSAGSASSNHPNSFIEFFEKTEWQNQAKNNMATQMTFLMSTWGYSPSGKTIWRFHRDRFSLEHYNRNTFIFCEFENYSPLKAYLEARFFVAPDSIDVRPVYNGILDYQTKDYIRPKLLDEGNVSELLQTLSSDGQTQKRFEIRRKLVDLTESLSKLLSAIVLPVCVVLAFLPGVSRWWFVVAVAPVSAKLFTRIFRRLEPKKNLARKSYIHQTITDSQVRNPVGKHIANGNVSLKQIIVFSPLKVASTSIYSALCQTLEVQELLTKKPYDREEYLKNPVKAIKLHNLDIENGYILNDHDNKISSAITLDSPIRMISGIREPISLYVSAYFQNNKSRFRFPGNSFTPKVFELNPYYLAGPIDILNISPKDMVDHFLSFDWAGVHDCNFDYYRHRILSFFGVDIFDHVFEKTKGFTVIRDRNIELFLYTMDSIENKSSEFSRALASFVGVDTISIPLKNTVAWKWDSQVVPLFKKELRDRNATDILEAAYESPYVEYFWDQNQIEEHRRKWVRSRFHG